MCTYICNNYIGPQKKYVGMKIQLFLSILSWERKKNTFFSPFLYVFYFFGLDWKFALDDPILKSDSATQNT